ncbi:MAG: MFS transporter [Hyphomicrobiaceae bacterium]
MDIRALSRSTLRLAKSGRSMPVRQTSKFQAVTLLVCAEIAAMSLWFVSAAVMPEMLKEADVSPLRQGLLSSGVQAGFVIGALAFAAIGLPDRFDPRRIFALCAIAAGIINLFLLVVPPGDSFAIAARVMTGLLLAGVYPVGMKIAVGWGTTDRGLLVGLIVGALTLGSASPHLISWLGGADWRSVVLVASALAAGGGALVLFSALGPHHAQAARLDFTAMATAWTNRRIRLAYAGYLGHMWELYAMWAWVGAAAAASYAVTMDTASAQSLAKLTAFFAIALGGLASIGAGAFADRYGKAETTIIAMAASGSAAVATALSFGGPVEITFVLIVIWGIAIIPDSAQFSAIVADSAAPDQAGSLMTFQTALGFALTFLTVQATPSLATAFGWPIVLAGLAIGPAFGILAMLRLMRVQQQI